MILFEATEMWLNQAASIVTIQKVSCGHKTSGLA